jgi:hypothetical protein
MFLEQNKVNKDFFVHVNDGYFLKNKRQMRRKTMQELYMSV